MPYAFLHHTPAEIRQAYEITAALLRRMMADPQPGGLEQAAIICAQHSVLSWLLGERSEFDGRLADYRRQLEQEVTNAG